MLLNSTLRAPFVKAAHPAASAAAAGSSTRTVLATSDAPVVIFSRLPHALAADRRLSPTDRLTAAALTFWACDRDTAEMSDKSLAEYLGVSIATIERSMQALAALGYVACARVRPTAANMTGRVVTLVWVANPSVLPAPPTRSARLSIPAKDLRLAPASAPEPAAAGGAPAEGAAPVRHPLPQERGAGALIAAGPPPSLVRDKEDRPREKLENSENGRGEDLPGRRRPQADVGAAPVIAMMATTAQPAASAEPIVAMMTTVAQPPTPSESPLARTDLLTDGQLRALAAMTPDQRACFEAKSPGVRAQILAPFAVGFDRLIFDGVTRGMLRTPRFVAEAKPVERTTPSLVAAVAGGDPRRVPDLAEQLCRDFGGTGDRRRWGSLHALGGQVLAGVVSAEDLLDAHRQAMGPKAQNRGAVFTTALRRLGWRPEDRLAPARPGLGR